MSAGSGWVELTIVMSALSSSLTTTAHFVWVLFSYTIYQNRSGVCLCYSDICFPMALNTFP